MYVPAREQSMCKGLEAPESVVHEQKEISVTGLRQQGSVRDGTLELDVKVCRIHKSFQRDRI